MARNTILILVQILIAVGGGYSIIGLALRNGYIERNHTFIAAKPRLLPESTHLTRNHYTGYKPFDEWLVGLVHFFWTVGSGQSPVLSLFAVYMAGQCLATHTIVLLEGLRTGNKGRIISYSTCWGLLYQNIPWGIIKPFYWALYLATSPLAAIASPKTSLPTWTAPSTNPKQTTLIPFAMTIGFIIPTLLAGLPSPSILTIPQKQLFLALWQPFPLWVAIAQFVLSLLTPSLTSKRSATPTPKASLSALRWTYTSILTLTFLTHSLTLLLAIFPSLLIHIFPIDPQTTAGISLSTFLIPQSPFSNEQMQSFAHGAHTMLLYDMYFAVGATLLWAVSVCTGGGAGRLGWVTGKAAMYTVVFGPGGAALALVWGRDEMVFEGVEKGGKKRV